MPQDRDGSVDRLLREALGPRSTPSVAGPCFDADTAAAWVDGTLTVSERSAAEAHAANCARCQAMLAAIARTGSAAPSSPWWRFRSSRWLVPLTAAVAGVLVWSVVSHPGRPTESAQRSDTPVDSLASATSTIASELENEKKEDRLAENQVASSGLRARGAKVAAAPRLQDLNDKSKDRAAPEPGTALRSDEIGRARQTAARSERDAGAPSQTDQALAAPVAAPPPLGESVGIAGRVSVMKETAKAASSPISWRIGPGGSVQRSTDGGSTWQAEQLGVSGASARFAALSSPSPTVCWLVGARGTVLLLAEGRTWQRIEFPEVVDLVSVRATDDHTATVTASDGRAFATSDRGTTWMRVPAR